MIQINLSKSDLNDAKRALVDINNGFQRAFSRALNKSATGVKTDMVALIREDYNYKVAAIRSRITIRNATYQNLEAAVKSTGGPVHLTDIVGTRQIQKGVSVDVKKSTGRQLIPRAFIRPGTRSGKMIVFRRAVVGGRMVGRTPIEARWASHPELIYNTAENWPRLQKSAGERLSVNFSHEVDVVLKGIA